MSKLKQMKTKLSKQEETIIKNQLVINQMEKELTKNGLFEEFQKIN